MSRKRKPLDPMTVEANGTAQAFTDIDALTAGMDHLRLSDSRLAPLIESFGAPDRLLAKDTSCFRSLAKSIIYQQLAGSAAAAIYARFLTACGVPDESQLTPSAVSSASPTALRACGLSERKASYLQDLAAHFEDGRLSDQLLTSVSDAELLERLTAVRGIGPWTVDMFAMFHLGHPNILPVGDLGVRKGLAHLCGLKHLPSAAEMQDLTAAWQPYRSLGCYYMWRIPLPPNNRQAGRATNSKAKGKAAGKTGSNSQQPYRPPAPAFPLGGAVPAVADVGVNPLAPVQAAAAAAVSLAASATRGKQLTAAAAVDILQVVQDVEQGTAAAAATQQAALVTPVKPLAPPPPAAAAAAGPDSISLQPLQDTQPGRVDPAAFQGAGSTLQQADGNTAEGDEAQHAAQQAAAAAGGGVMTRRRLRWAQQTAAAAAGGVESGGSAAASQQQARWRARIVDL